MDLRGIAVAIVVLAVSFGAGVKFGWDWRSGDLAAKMVKVKLAAERADRKRLQQLETDLGAARAAAGDAEAKAVAADVERSRMAQLAASAIRSAGACTIDEASIDGLNAVLEASRK